MVSLRHILCFLFYLSGAFILVNGQNLIDNYSFETITECPDGFGGIGPTIAPPWEAPTIGTPDVYNECSVSWITDVPLNFFGDQAPVTGAGYCGIYCKIETQQEYREYIQAPFIEPLIAGEWYYIGFYVSLADNYCAVEHIGAYISVDPPGGQFTSAINVTPQIESNFGFLTETEEWILISGCYQAEGGENYITIGNFHPEDDSPLDPNCGGNLSYYFCDDVYVLHGIEGDDFTLDLGDPVTACFSYEIDPGISGYTYTWSDGSHDPTLVVTESGTYSLSISEECIYATDSIEVTILGNAPPVDLGPEELTICEGEVYTISLDPDLSEYTWQDGSTGPSYDITTPGVYSVTFDDGCSTSSDQIIIDVNAPPPPVLFDDEAFLCPGEEIVFDFDPSIGEFLWQDGSTSPTYSVSFGGVYSLTITNDCGSVTDEILVTSIEFPEVELGPFEQDICFGTDLDLIVDPSYGDIVWQDNSTDPVYTVTGGGLYAVTISNQCGMASDEVFFMELEAPEIFLGPDEQTICEGDLIEFDFDPDLGDFLWQDGTTQSYYSINSPGVYSVEVTNICGTGVAQIEVSVIDPPSIDLGPDLVLCPDDSLLLSLDPNDKTFIWQDGTTSNEFLITSSGSYVVTVSNFCGEIADSVSINYLVPLIPPDLGADVTLCPGEQITLFANTPNANYIWSDLSTDDSLVITSEGTYHLLVYNDCQEASDTIVVSINDSPPVLNLPAQLVLCQGDSITLNAAVSGVSFLWNDGSTNQKLGITSPGSYSLTVSNTCGTAIDTVVVVDGGPPPSVELGSDTSFCAGQIISLTPDFANVNQWLWQDGSTLPSYSISTPGQFSVQVSNSCGTAFDTIYAILLPAIPPLDLGLDTSVCPGESVVLNIATPNVQILWSDGSTGPSLTTTTEGLYFASITNSCGSSFDTMAVTYLPDIPVLNLGADQALCPGEVISISPGINNVTYEWQDGSTNNFYSTSQAETIILTISNSCGSSTDTLVVFENNQGPQVDLGPDILACDGDVITIPSGISGVNYLWQDGSTNSNFVTSVSGEFILEVSNACGVDTDTILVDIHGSVPVVDLGPDTSLCEGISLTLSSAAEAETFVAWQDGSSQPTYSVTSGGIYSLYESNHCGEATDTILISFVDAPSSFNLGADTTLCPDEFITLTAPSDLFDVLWSDGSSLPDLIVDQEGVYWLQLSNECGIVADSLVLSVDNSIPVLNLDSSIPWCEGDVITLDAAQPFSADYLWSTGAITSSIDVSVPAIYNITVSTLCSSVVQEVDVYPGDDCLVPNVKDDLFIPNVFSPNGDGINDVFTVSVGPDLNVISMQGSIYDRWGNLVFSSDDNPFIWDGLNGGQGVLPGVYVYVISIKTDVQGTSQVHRYAGDVTLMR